MGRFMEAMVVCKKGVKAHPNRPDPRLLLARVYAEQGKDKKALEELQGALGVAPTDRTRAPRARRRADALGRRRRRQGDAAEGWDLDPKDPETAAAFARWKVEAAEAPTSPRATARAGRSGSPCRWPADRPASPRCRRPGAAPAGRAHAPARSTGCRCSAPAGPRAAAAEIEDDDRLPPPAAKKAHATRFLITAFAGVAIIGGWYGYGQWKAARDIKLKKSLKEASEQLRHDSFASYKKATDAATAALDIDPNSALAHGYLAYAYAIRWGEHGDGDDARRLRRGAPGVACAGSGTRTAASPTRPRRSSRATRGRGPRRSPRSRARSRRSTRRGRPAPSSTSPRASSRCSSVTWSAHARAWRRRSRRRRATRASTRPWARCYRRRGDARAADQNYGFALRYERDHPESLLGQGAAGARLGQRHRLLAGRGDHLKKLLDADPPPSPRQLAVAHLARALLVSPGPGGDGRPPPGRRQEAGRGHRRPTGPARPRRRSRPRRTRRASRSTGRTPSCTSSGASACSSRDRRTPPSARCARR